MLEKLFSVLVMFDNIFGGLSESLKDPFTALMYFIATTTLTVCLFSPVAGFIGAFGQVFLGMLMASLAMLLGLITLTSVNQN